MHADIVTNEQHFNQLKMSRYSMFYDNIPQTLYDKFKNEVYLDNSKCQSARETDGPHPNTRAFEIEINVKN